MSKPSKESVTEAIALLGHSSDTNSINADYTSKICKGLVTKPLQVICCFYKWKWYEYHIAYYWILQEIQESDAI